jgi:hypothetical protein
VNGRLPYIRKARVYVDTILQPREQKKLTMRFLTALPSPKRATLANGRADKRLKLLTARQSSVVVVSRGFNVLHASLRFCYQIGGFLARCSSERANRSWESEAENRSNPIGREKPREVNNNERSEVLSVGHE